MTLCVAEQTVTVWVPSISAGGVSPKAPCVRMTPHSHLLHEPRKAHGQEKPVGKTSCEELKGK